MKKLAALVAIVLVLLPASTLLAFSFGIGPPEVDFEVTADGSTVVAFYVTSDFNGSLEVSLEDIPLDFEPKEVAIAAGDSNKKVEITFYGDQSLGTNTYEGKVRFLAMTGGNVATGVKIRATVNHTVDQPEEPYVPPGQNNSSSSQTSSGDDELPIIPVVGLLCGTAVIITLILVKNRSKKT